ncbi:MAG: hypothetical protein CMH63_02125 [Nanoarchaeota archaeon]|jgi:carboxylesterase|nr:hypothetical protein [Nanoarchaeota archaeon]|tara:strand:+ start:20840 stop:21715 length:876 start_codon:yes stop_codon:yes gene_type:complete
MKFIENKFLSELVKKRGWITSLLLVLFLIVLSRTVNEMGVNYVANQQERNPDGIIVGAEPVFREGDGKVGLLLIHGYSSSPSDFRELVEFLSEKGITIHVPLLPGHGTHPKDLRESTYQEWQSVVEESLEKLNTEKKFVLGFSMGGTLALDLASKKNLDGLMTLNAAIFLANRWLPFISIISIVETYVEKKPESIIGFINEKRVVYDSIPLSSILELQDLIKQLNIKKVTEPLLIFQSDNDKTVLPESANYIFNNVQSKDKELINLGNSTHASIENEQAAFEEIYNFITTH